MITDATFIHTWFPMIWEKDLQIRTKRNWLAISSAIFRRKCQYLFFSVRIHNKVSCLSLLSSIHWVGKNQTGSQCFSYFFIQSGVPCTIFWQHKNKEKGDKTLFCYINIYSNPLLLKSIANIQNFSFSHKINAAI